MVRTEPYCAAGVARPQTTAPGAVYMVAKSAGPRVGCIRCNQLAVGTLNPMRDKNEGVRIPGGRRDATFD